jgi:hypothetical protein
MVVIIPAPFRMVPRRCREDVGTEKAVLLLIDTCETRFPPHGRNTAEGGLGRSGMPCGNELRAREQRFIEEETVVKS